MSGVVANVRKWNFYESGGAQLNSGDSTGENIGSNVGDDYSRLPFESLLPFPSPCLTPDYPSPSLVFIRKQHHRGLR